MKMRFAVAAAAAASLLAGQALAADTVLRASLSGAYEKPSRADPRGSGRVKVTIKDEKQVCWDLQTKDLPGATAAHIHRGGPNEAGSVAVALTPPDSNGHSQGCARVTAGVGRDLAADPRGYYVNVHTPAFPAGAIRGQLGN
ncbi:MAG: CHRD domain-containing protein [Phenylobacterium sp.]|nr:MAG: CHRD domain-containing protein [Phenylobacterium sp.]